MKKGTINIVLPFPSTKPGGGHKVMYEYANRLSKRGHDVMIYHSIKRPFKSSMTPMWYKRLVFALRNVARPKWFTLDSQIRSVIVPSITEKYIRNADVVMSTWWQMTYAISELPLSKGRKFNLIQGYEIWKGQNELVDKSYALPVHNIVIANYLRDIVKTKTGKEPTYIPNAIDTEIFTDDGTPRNEHQVLMLYSEEPVKGSRFGLEALLQVKQKYPALVAVLFGTGNRPDNLPDWIIYHKQPKDLPELYRQSVIFISPSLGEGFGLPPAEALGCGCAIVVTDVGGHPDFVKNNETGLLVPPEQPELMSEKILLLLTDVALRERLSRNGQQLIRSQFNWDASVSKLENIFFKTD